jgi:GR25 family glycosyltransferase involved in LPS biosynthesis
MRKRAYQTRDPLARMACALSHYKLWLKSIETNEPILVLEHDSRFLHRLDPQPILESKFNIVGVNDPIGATRLARKFSEKVKSYNKDIVPIPTIDNFDVPQGLAGNSAYIIKPAGAKAVVQAVKEYGLWPNDAIMCKQLIKKMGVTQQYYTVVQGLPSTTTD